MLIDGGPSMKILEKLENVMPLYSKTIDIVLLTHPHSDHVNGLVEILKRYNVGYVLIVGTPSKNPYYQKFLKLIKEKNIKLIFADAKHDIKLGASVFVDILWPIDKKIGVNFKNLNNASLAVKILYKNHAIMLTGDAEVEEESEIVASGFDLSADILKAGHHGSRTASTNMFLDKVNPQEVVIQCGQGNKFGHPHKETLIKFFDRGINVKRNDLEGRVDFIFN
jgi:competence protein ComEC